MSDRFERRARWIRLTVWTGAVVALLITGAVTVNVAQKNRTLAHREAAAMAAANPTPDVLPPVRPVDYDAYERANAKRNSDQIAREAADYTTYQAAREAKVEPAMRKLPDPLKP